MNKIKVIKNGDLNKKILRRKLSIIFIMLLFILELLCIPYSVASFTTLAGLDEYTKTTDSDNSSPVVVDAPIDESTILTVTDDTPADTKTGSTIVDDSITIFSGSSYVVNDKFSDYSDNLLITDNKSNDHIDSSLIDNYIYYVPNERVVSPEEIVSISENILGYLSSGIEKEIKIVFFDDIESVKLIPTTDLEEVKVTIIKLKDKPEEIIDPPNKNISIYKYLDIKLITNETYVEEDEINSLEFKFKVEKTWINDNKIDRDTIKLIRYHDGVWQDLSTTLNSENETYIYYTASSPGFSTFAVVGSKVVEKSLTYDSDVMSIPWLIIFAFIIILSIVLVFILFKSRYIYLKEDNN